MGRFGRVVLVAGAFVLGACGDQAVEGTGSSDSGASDPVLFDAGTPIGDGFVVPASSVALTQPITPEAPQGPSSWSVELVPDDPIEAIGAHDGPHDYEPSTIAPMPDTFPAADEPPDPPELAVGDSLIPSVEPGLWEAWEPQLVEGSRLVVPTRSPICQGGFASVLDITGDPDTVMAEYVEQLRAWSAEYGQPPETSEVRLFDRRVVRSEASVDGTSLTATMVVGLDGEPTRMNYVTC